MSSFGVFHMFEQMMGLELDDARLVINDLSSEKQKSVTLGDRPDVAERNIL